MSLVEARDLYRLYATPQGTAVALQAARSRIDRIRATFVIDRASCIGRGAAMGGKRAPAC